MSEADVVLTGAEAVVESGGIINRVTTKTLHKFNFVPK